MIAKRILASAIFLSLMGEPIHACTTVFSNENGPTLVVARTMDLYISDSPRLHVYPKGMERMGKAGENSAHWTSHFGSVVITAFQTDAVSDGMNEEGLAAHLLYLTDATYEQRDTQIPAISNGLLAQYLLDNFKTVNEALDGLQQIQVVSMPIFGREWPVHLSLEDAGGDSAVIEFTAGKMNIYHSPKYTIMTNEPAYPIQLKNITRYQSFGGTLPLPGDTDPLSRFVRVSTYLKTLPLAKTPIEAIANVLSVIRTATVPFGAIDTSGNKTTDAWSTRWISIADLTHKVYYFNSMTTPNIVWIDLTALNFAKDAPVLSVDPNHINYVGNLSKWLK
jgi:penicillin V acylase-like amidase (Ntn superfamily)